MKDSDLLNAKIKCLEIASTLTKDETHLIEIYSKLISAIGLS
jgi:hypothetical protein